MSDYSSDLESFHEFTIEGHNLSEIHLSDYYVTPVEEGKVS